jgi:hypothetical protein
MTAFTDAIHEWETFYLLTGTAGVTLIGLLFIAISILKVRMAYVEQLQTNE